MLITNRVLVFTRMDAMISRASRYGRRHGPCRVQQSTFERFLHTCPPDLLRSQGGRLISLPGYPESAPENGASRRPTKLLLNVSIERSLGPVQVVMSPENSVGDLVKRAMEIYVREKRRPLLVGNDPHRFQLHYSQFSLESLKAEEKLINLGSRNFFMCSKPKTFVNSTNCSEQANKEANSLFPLTKLMDYLL